MGTWAKAQDSRSKSQVRTPTPLLGSLSGVTTGQIGGWGSRCGLDGLPAAPVVQGSCTGPCFGSQQLTNGSWFVAVLYLVYNLPQQHMHAIIFHHVQFLCILLLKKTFVHVQALL